MSKFILLLGPSGVGKSSIIQELKRMDSRFTYISPYITRSLRKEEKDKISISDLEMDEMRKRKELLVINSLYGVRYATPRIPIMEALAKGSFPILDWPIERIKIMSEAFLGQLYSVYIAPPSVKILAQRLEKDGRDTDGSRFKSALKELEIYWSGGYSGLYDFSIVSEDGKIVNIAHLIYQSYLKSS